LAETYGLEIGVPLEESLIKMGVAAEQVTDVIFTHLHFDHGSGAFRRVPGSIVKVFPNARYHVWKEHYDYALKPEPSEASSFFTKFFRYVDRVHWLEEWKGDWIKFMPFYGHTRGMVVPVMLDGRTSVYYLSDLVPMEIFLDYDVYSGYDLDPDLAIREKQELLSGFTGSNRIIYFHDPLKSSSFYP
jgi:glyoxylase-like metal-dependent hydrolase (beta-lactamase superfamily II)